MLSPGEVIVGGRPTLMFGSNNYLGLTLHPDVTAAARARRASNTAPARPARAPPTARSPLHEDLEREFADWFGKRHAIIFSTGYQANLSLIGGLCGAGDVILIDGDSHASIYDATRQTRGAGHRLPPQLAGEPAQEARAAAGAGERNRLVVVEGLYSIRGDVAPLREIVDVCRAHGAYLMVDEAHSLGTYGATGLGCAEAQGVLDRGRLRRRHVLEVAGRHRRRLRVESSGAARAAFSGAGLRVHRVRFAVQRRQRPRGRPRRARSTPSCAISSGRTSAGSGAACSELGYVIGETESPIVPILTGDEERTIALWQRLLAEGLYVNLIVPPGCPVDACVLRASCSAAHTPEQHHPRARHLRPRRRRARRHARRDVLTNDSDYRYRAPPSDTDYRLHPTFLSVPRVGVGQPFLQPISATMPRRSRRRSTRQTNPSDASSA